MTDIRNSFLPLTCLEQFSLLESNYKVNQSGNSNSLMLISVFNAWESQSCTLYQCYKLYRCYLTIIYITKVGVI